MSRSPLSPWLGGRSSLRRVSPRGPGAPPGAPAAPKARRPCVTARGTAIIPAPAHPSHAGRQPPDLRGLTRAPTDFPIDLVLAGKRSRGSQGASGAAGGEAHQVPVIPHSLAHSKQCSRGGAKLIHLQQWTSRTPRDNVPRNSERGRARPVPSSSPTVATSTTWTKVAPPVWRPLEANWRFHAVSHLLRTGRLLLPSRREVKTHEHDWRCRCNRAWTSSLPGIFGF